MRSKKAIVSVLILAMMIFLIAGCGAQTAQQNKPQTASDSSQKQAQPSSEWDQLVQNANKEGKLNIFGQGNISFQDKVIGGFNKKYPNIKIQVTTGLKTADVLSKIVSPKRAGVNDLDLMMFGTTDIYNELIPAGYVAPMKDYLILDDFKDPSKWVQGKLEYADNEQKYILPVMLIQGNQLLVNTKLVDVSKLTSYEDLLKPEFKGKIVASHPKIVGQSKYAFGFFYDYYGESYFQKLAANEPVVNQDVKQLIDWIAQGKYAIGISPGNADAFKEYIDAGIPIVGMQLKEGGYYSPGYNNIAILKDAPHPNATKLFTNWLLTKEGQELIIEALQGSSVRTDVSKPIKFEANKKYFAPHIQSNSDILKKAGDAFDKYIKQ